MCKADLTFVQHSLAFLYRGFMIMTKCNGLLYTVADLKRYLLS